MESEVETLKQQAAALDEKIQGLEEQIVALHEKVKSKEQKRAEARAARGILKSARAHAAAGRIEDAKKDLKHLIDNYSMQQVTPFAQQDLREINLLGQDAGEIDAEKWFTASTTMGAGKVTVLIFWEAWNSSSIQELPRLELLYQKYQDKGLNIIGLTRVNSSSTDEKVETFISEHQLSFPIAKDNEEAMSKRYAVFSVPAAALIKDGKIGWRGSVQEIKEKFLEEWLEGN